MEFLKNFYNEHKIYVYAIGAVIAAGAAYLLFRKK